MTRNVFFVNQSGSAVFYILLAVGLMAALTFAFVNDSRENTNTQTSYRLTEDLFMQVNFIKAAIVECTIQYPTGDTVNNLNVPWPMTPNHASNPYIAADAKAKNMTCSGAPNANKASMFGTSSGSKGRILPQPPSGMNDWTYTNDVLGVRIQITGVSSGAALIDALTKLDAKFNTCEADVNYAACGTNCFTAWLIRATCP